MMEPHDPDDAGNSPQFQQRWSWPVAVLLIGACLVFGWFVIGALLRRVFQ